MGVGKQKQRYAAARLALGSFKLHGNERVTRLTIPKKLDNYDFPNETGNEVRVELIEPEDEAPYLEVKPVDE